MTPRPVSDVPRIHPLGCSCRHCVSTNASRALPLIAGIVAAGIGLCLMLGPNALLTLIIN